MKTTRISLPLVALSAFLLPLLTFSQGPLAPPGAPAPNYRALDEVRPGQPLPSLDPDDVNLIQGPEVEGISVAADTRIHNCKVLVAPGQTSAFRGLRSGQVLLVTDSEWRGARLEGFAQMLWRDNLVDGDGVTYGARPFWAWIANTNNYFGRSIVHRSSFRNITPPFGTQAIDPTGLGIFSSSTFEDIDGNVVFDARDTLFDDCRFAGIAGKAIHSQGPTQVHDSRFEDIGGYAIDPAIDSIVTHTEFDRMQTAAIGGGFANRLLAMHNRVGEANNGFELMASSLLFDNRFHGVTNIPITARAGTFHYNNHIKGGVIGIKAEQGAHRIEANYIENFSQFGIELGGDNNDVIGNTVMDDTAPAPDAALYAESDRNVFRDNQFVGVLGVGLNLRDGINNVIVGNTVWFGFPNYNFIDTENFYGEIFDTTGTYDESRWINIGRNTP